MEQLTKKLEAISLKFMENKEYYKAGRINLAIDTINEVLPQSYEKHFYAVFMDYGNDLNQKSIWFDDKEKAIEYKNDKMNVKGKYIILEKSGDNGL